MSFVPRLPHLERWVSAGVAPPQSPRLTVNPQQPGTFQLDSNGEALGGIRTPQVAAPIAKVSRVGQPQTPIPGRPALATNLCVAFGTTVPPSSSQLTALYPSHTAFVNAWNNAVDREVRAGFLLAADATRLKSVAAQSTIQAEERPKQGSHWDSGGRALASAGAA